MSRLAYRSGRFMAAALAVLMFAALPQWALGDDDADVYLVEFEATGAGAPKSREQAIELLEGLIVPSLEGLAEEQRVLAGGLYVGARAGAFVVRASSHDAVTELVRALPAWGVWEWKVKPLESFGHRAELEREVIESLRSGE